MPFFDCLAGGYLERMPDREKPCLYALLAIEANTTGGARQATGAAGSAPTRGTLSAFQAKTP